MIEPVASHPASLRLLADQAFSRTAGAPLVAGNAIRLLKDANENYPAWLAAIRAATRSIFFESYIVGNDATGREFRDALIERARAGVRVRVLHDWLGCNGPLGTRFWKSVSAAGAEVRAFNPPRLDSPLGWLSRDHRKSICVDGRVAFISGLCITKAWLGDPAAKKGAWRDTGIELRGPAVADAERAFAQVWAAAGPQLGNDELSDRSSIPVAGDVLLRVVASAPAVAGLMRLDQLIAAIARHRLWLTDAYFFPIPTYVQALCAASRDGVDVRLLVPGASDIPFLSPLSRSAYRPLLDAGVRVFEWNGTMLHAKTAVADGRWARVGSTNLNLASFIGNYELDVAVEDARFAGEMERQYRDDLTGATEIVLRERRKRVKPVPADGREKRTRRAPSGSAGRAAAGAVRFGTTVRTAITGAPPDYTESRMMAGAAVLLAAIALTGAFWPRVLATPPAVIAAWFAIALVIRAWRGWRARSRRKTGSEERRQEL